MNSIPKRFKVFIALILLRVGIVAILVMTGFSFGQQAIQTGEFEGGGWLHRAAGEFTISEQTNEYVLTFSEDFKVNRGPDLFVWLVKGDNTKEHVNVGRLQNRKGEQQYVLPESVNLEEYNRVIIWCRAFRVMFASAEFNSINQ